MGFGGEGGAGGGDGVGGDGLVEEGVFGGGAGGRGGRRRLAAAMRMSSMRPSFEEGEGGEGDLGDGLGVAGAYFADVVLVAGEVAGDGDAVEELVGAEGGLLVAEVEVGVGDCARAAWWR